MSTLREHGRTRIIQSISISISSFISLETPGLAFLVHLIEREREREREREIEKSATEAEIHVRNRLILRSIQTAKNIFRGSFSGRRGMLGFEPQPSFDSSK
ncbi:unnamed protein product [Spirodela intermedia]|uniref:Uncharacterized protein n=1 Tax=Spirodela intermedia TaxID=51605 RepID=A0A7I8LIE5_SPIIN|nr:unnamed protein product [Spirodela intermedia]